LGTSAAGAASAITPASHSIIRPAGNIIRPGGIGFLDYEVELGLVLGADLPVGTTMADADLTRYVVALVVADDVSARQIQLVKTQFYEAKPYPTFTPVGPWLTLIDAADLARLGSLRLTLRVNGQVAVLQTAGRQPPLPARRRRHHRHHRLPRRPARPRHAVHHRRPDVIMSATMAPRAQEPVIVVGAGPVGCTAALLLADSGIPVTLLERRTQPYPLPRAVHLDDELAGILGRIGVSEGFLARSRPGSGLRLLDARHRVMAEFRREHQTGEHGFPQANMFHQPDLEELLPARVGRHPLITFRRGAEACGLDGTAGAVTADPAAPAGPVRVHARVAGEPQTFTGQAVLGCDGATGTIRELTGITTEDLGFTERWLVIPGTAWGRSATPPGPPPSCTSPGTGTAGSSGCSDGEDETGLITPQALGRLLQPWTGRSDLGGLQIIRTATYIFRARLASRF
jgi:hypothetical protein